MRFLTFIIFLCASVANLFSQQNHYVRAGASGSADGSDWANAYTSLPSSLTRGDTYYIAAGSYSGYTYDDAASGTTLITIKKATVADHGTETGWDDSYGAAQAVFSGSLTFSTAYWLFDGQTGGGPASWKTGHGFKIAVTGPSSGAGAYIDASDVTMRHFEVEGNGGDDAGGGPNDSLWIGGDRFRCSYAYLWNSGRCHFFCNRGNTGVIIEYTWTGYHETHPDQHSEIASIHDDSLSNPSGDADDWTFRWCVFTHAEGTGGIMVVGDNLQVYGCVFAPLDGNSLGGGNGMIGTWSANVLTGAKIYNNTFINVDSRGIGLLDGNDSGEFKNNIFYNGDVGNDGNGITRLTHTHNYYISLGDGPVTEATQTTDTGDPFTDWASGDFSLTENTTAGTDLGSPYNVDMYGNTRSTWTRGAIEFGSGEPPEEDPPAPRRLIANKIFVR